MASINCSGAAKRLLRCFCGCTELSEDEVERIYRLSCGATLINSQSVKLLRTFIEQQRSGDKNETEQMLDIYQKCGEYSLREDSILTLDDLDELCDMGLKYNLEKDLKKQIRTGVKSNINRCLLRIQSDCCNEIEISQDFKGYKQALLNKLKGL